ncbi:unnamed protein product (macronuclear) [Paramecium tetraurelia]|uniref:Mini antigen n=1 Tax=Paramecium tetraurelia TaxID=5888 RepID=A0D6T2_PARTE|nr:uncharacterized protein GSPATT00001790001 [Paramecium tetraurelia]CAK78749.1 unnamed protein product [Paramecium tetraurelia]|eukprot:XP_001446146.1 hypothetical protein (macronuclear) [Paramecium tetraurelia strain d4-2]
MKKLSLAILLISITYAQLTFNALNKCTCGDLTTQQDCAQSQPICSWDSKASSCSTVSCSSISDQTNCANNLKCMWNGKGCVDFTLCNQLTGANQADCLAKSKNCPQSDGKNCASEEALKSCSSYSNQTICDLTISSNGVCYWSNSGCSEVSSCAQLNSNSCSKVGNACLWNATLNNCTQASCAQYGNNNTCTYYQTQLNKLIFQLCQWNAANSSCISATDTSALNINTCYNQTKYTYRWSSSSNKCDVCAGKIIYVLIMAIIMIMI